MDKVDATKGKKFTLEVTKGNATLYFSRTEQEPDEENYEYKMTASDGQPAEFEVTPEDLQSASSGSSFSGVSRRKRQASQLINLAVEGTGDVTVNTEERTAADDEVITETTTTRCGSAGSALTPFGFLAAMLTLIAVSFK